MILEKVKWKKIDMVIFKFIFWLVCDLKDLFEIWEVFLVYGVWIILVEEGYDLNKVGKNDMVFELWLLFFV